MHDLNTINSLNRERHTRSIHQWRYEGKHVVATYAGSTLMSAVPYETMEEAGAAAAAVEQLGSVYCTIWAPSQSDYVPRRDQSEDRVLRARQVQLSQWQDQRNAPGAR
jgi:hypothetical protein